MMISFPFHSMRFAEAYHRYTRQTPYYRKDAAELISKFNAGKGGNIVDFGAGTGVSTSEIISRLNPEHVVAVDSSSAMLEHAKNNLGEHAGIQYLLSDGRDMGTSIDWPVDAIYASAVWHWLNPRHLPVILRACHSILRPGGCLCFFDDGLTFDHDRLGYDGTELIKLSRLFSNILSKGLEDDFNFKLPFAEKTPEVTTETVSNTLKSCDFGNIEFDVIPIPISKHHLPFSWELSIRALFYNRMELCLHDESTISQFVQKIVTQTADSEVYQDGIDTIYDHLACFKTIKPDHRRQMDAGAAVALKKFCKDSGRQKWFKSNENRYAPYWNSNGGLKSDLVEDRACELCGHMDFETLFVKDRFPHVRCNQCGFVFVTPCLKEKVRMEALSCSEWVDILDSRLERQFNESRFNYGLDIITKYLAQGEHRRLLDVGTASGHFLELAQNKGFSCKGLEVNQIAVQRAQDRGLDVINASLADASLDPGSVQVMTFWEVFDDMRYPKSVIREAHRVLEPGGLLFFLMPNVESLAVRIMHEHSPTFSALYSISFFTNKLLENTLAQEGFERLFLDSIIQEVVPINNYLEFNPPHGGLEPTMLLNLTEEDMHQRLLGYKLMALFRKANK